MLKDKVILVIMYILKYIFIIAAFCSYTAWGVTSIFILKQSEHEMKPYLFLWFSVSMFLLAIVLVLHTFCKKHKHVLFD
jgi:asparagine N-glycosylation enzyme membrane subunit Stt3